MTVPAPRQGQCPNCGATVTFKLGSSRATVCEYCKAVVARAGQDFSVVGQVADLIPTGSQLAVGSKGTYRKVHFEVVGRLQYEWQAGVWDEWYVGLADGRWGWLAEAQGQYYVTFKTAQRNLPSHGLRPGAKVSFSGLGTFTVSDVKNAKIVGVEGELPEPVTLGESPLTVDLESTQGAFATLDYGVAGSEPALYLGGEVPFEALHLGAPPAGMAALKGARPSGDKLKCPHCGAPITVRLPEQTVRLTCESCKHLLDTSHGAFRVIEAVGRGKHEPRIPLGTKGTLRGNAYLVVGWMIRSCKVDGIRYPWDEYLLWNEHTRSFSWLVDSGGHWQHAVHIPVAAVDVGMDARYAGKSYKHFSAVNGVVEKVLGEFYWAVHAGESALLDDYIAPPLGLSSERTPHEESWSAVSHLEAAEVAEAFGRPGIARAASGVGALQPWPYEAAWHSMGRWMLGGLGALVALTFVLMVRTMPVYLDESFNTLQMRMQGATGPHGEHVHSYLSRPFDLAGHQALNVTFSSDVSQSWAYAGGAVINDASGVSVPFGLESSSYSGYEGGESWSEGSRTASQAIPSPGLGKTVVRADLQWDPKRVGPPNMHIKVTGDSFSGWQFLWAFLLLLSPMLLLWHRASFESARWEESNLSSGDD